ncbi:CYTH domain-containing protein [Clostridium sp.]|uniref:CYTH domain-containing protein n=1 Tax=Clostridium sp. TaxID=1506 RepID=UPI003F354B6F
MNIIEKEIKILLDTKDFLDIKGLLDDKHVDVHHKYQRNYYIDTKDSLFNSINITIRIRTFIDKKNGELTIKIPLKKEKEYALIKKELTLSLTGKEIDYILHEKSTKGCHKINNFINYTLKQSKNNYYYVMGDMLTERYKYKLHNKNMEICLDKNLYLNFYDYELEIEYDNLKLAEDLILNELSNIHYLKNKQALSKRNRFFERLYKLNN